jgi:hypothetical protein
MSVAVLESHNGLSAFYCTGSNTAFGPVFQSAEEAEAFRQSLELDPRYYTEAELQRKYELFAQESVCACGEVADGKPGRDEEELGAPLNGYPLKDGNKFVCNYCIKKQAKAKAATA